MVQGPIKWKNGVFQSQDVRDELVGAEGHGGKLRWLSVLVGDPGGKNSGELPALRMHIWR